MANSGSFNTGGYKGNGYPDHYTFNWWVISQSIEGNYTDIGWNVVGGGGSTNSRYTMVKQRYVNVNGSEQYSEALVKTYNGTVPFSGSTRIYHNSDGTGSFSASCGGAFYYYGKYNSTGSGSWELPTIPRASSIGSSAYFTKGDDITISVNRASSSFTHTIRVYVGSTLIKTFYGVGGSVTWTPSQSEVETMLNVGTSCSITCDTYSGSTHIGSSSTSGTAYNPTISSISNTPSASLGSDTTIYVSRNKSYYTHTLNIKVESTSIKSIYGVATSATLNFTSSEVTTIYGLVKNGTSAVLTVECTTYIRGAYAGRTSKTGTVSIKSTGNEPTFTNWTYRSLDTIANSVLGTNQALLQGHNGIEITCGEAIGKNQAYIVKYQAIINGLTYETTDTTNRKITIPSLNLSGDNTCQVRAIDSRGLVTVVQKTLTFLPYNDPTIPTIKMERRNNYDKDVTLTLEGKISKIFYNNSIKNDITLFMYRYKKITDTEYGNWVDIPTSTIPNTSSNYYKNISAETFGIDPTALGDFDEEENFTFQFRLKDKITDIIFTATLIKGTPLVAFRKGKVGINCVPNLSGKDGLYVNNPDVDILSAEAVKTPTFTNGWSNYSYDYDSAGYYKDKDRVFLQGVIRGGSVGSSAFTLPTGYRPTKRKMFIVISNNYIGRVDILNNGNVYIDSMCSNSYVSLDNISFRV